MDEIEEKKRIKKNTKKELNSNKLILSLTGVSLVSYFSIDGFVWFERLMNKILCVCFYVFVCYLCAVFHELFEKKNMKKNQFKKKKIISSLLIKISIKLLPLTTITAILILILLIVVIHISPFLSLNFVIFFFILIVLYIIL